MVCKDWQSVHPLHLHILTMRCNYSQISGITDLGLTPRKVNRIAVVGGGQMGSGIATALIVSDYHVVLKEVNESSLLDGIDRVKGDQNFFIH